MAPKRGGSGDQEVGAKIRALRRAKHWTLKELAEKSGFDPPNLSKLETGRIGFSAESIRGIARALEVGVGDLFTSPSHRPVFWVSFLAQPERPPLPTIRNVSRLAFALEVSDDALAPLVQSRDIVIVEPKLPLNMGRAVVAECEGRFVVRKVRSLKRAKFSEPVKKHNKEGEYEEWTMEEDAVFEIYTDNASVPPMEAKVVPGSSCQILGPVVQRITDMYSYPTL